MGYKIALRQKLLLIRRVATYDMPSNHHSPHIIVIIMIVKGSKKVRST